MKYNRFGYPVERHPEPVIRTNGDDAPTGRKWIFRAIWKAVGIVHKNSVYNKVHLAKSDKIIGENGDIRYSVAVFHIDFTFLKGGAIRKQRNFPAGVFLWSS